MTLRTLPTITRGRKKDLIVGEPAACGMAVRNAESKLRARICVKRS